MAKNCRSEPEETARVFSQTITTHGVSYVGDKSNWSLAERLFWVFAVIACGIYCSTMVVEFLESWGKNKFVVRLESFAHPAQVMKVQNMQKKLHMDYVTTN